MARAADDSVDGDEAAPGADGDAVVARADGRTGDVDVFAPVDVDAVGVGAVLRRGDGELRHVDLAAHAEPDVNLRAVLAAELAQLHVGAVHDHQGMYPSM